MRGVLLLLGGSCRDEMALEDEWVSLRCVSLGDSMWLSSLEYQVTSPLLPDLLPELSGKDYHAGVLK